MTIVRYREWAFDADIFATRRAYAEWAESRERGLAVRRQEMAENPKIPWSGCQRCLNYETARVRGAIFPSELSRLFEQLGMVPLHETELLCAFRKPELGRFHYLATYTFLGNLVSGRDAQIPGRRGSGRIDAGYYENLTPDLSIGFTKYPFVGGPFNREAPQIEAWLYLGFSASRIKRTELRFVEGPRKVPAREGLHVRHLSGLRAFAAPV